MHELIVVHYLLSSFRGTPPCDVSYSISFSCLGQTLSTAIDVVAAASATN